MGHHDQTDMGGSAEVFLTTHWSLVEHIQAHGDKDQVLIGLLLDRYWKPVYCYLRHKAYSNEKAKDLTQGFFHDVVLNYQLVQRADQAKGRFRTFLLHALDQYLINEKQRENAQKRRPKGSLVSLDMLTPPAVPTAVERSNPEDSYNYAWTAAMLDHVLADVETQCIATGMQTHWRVFYERVVEPILADADPPSLSSVCERHGVENQRKASNMITTVKRRLQKALTRYLAHTATSDADVQAEFAEIRRFFAECAQDRE